MRIHKVNMAVPVGRPAADDRDDLETEVSTEMAAVRDRCIRAVRQRHRFAFGARQRALRQQRFEVELKGIAKKLASTACGSISDRDIRTGLRVRLYTDLSTLAQTISSEIEAAGEHHRRRLKRMRLTLLLAVLAAGLSVWIWLAGYR